jgi:hypothetical protein
MEKQPKTSELLTYKGRQKLLKNVLTIAEGYHVQLVGASENFRAKYIPLFSSLKLINESELSTPEQNHLRRMIAVQADVLNVVDPEASRLNQFREEEVEPIAGPEIAQWHDIKERQAVLSREWKFSYNDADKIAQQVRERLDSLQQ